MEYGITPVFYKNYTAFKAKNADGSRKYKYIINTGSSRSSKTYSLLELIHRICENNKNIRATAWRDTKKDCKDTIWKDYQKILSLSGRLKVSQRNKTESSYHFPETDSYFEFHGSDDEEKVHGLTQQIAWINEPYKISQPTFDQIDMRSDVIFIDWNPKKNHWIDKLSQRDNAIVIHSTFMDNPFCPEQTKIKLLSFKPTPENIANGTADEYMWQVYGLGLKAEKPNRIYRNWVKISVDDFERFQANSYYGTDFGSANPTATVEVKWDGKDGFLVRQRLYTPSQHFGCSLSEMYDKIGVRRDIPNICDSAEPDSIADLLQNKFRAFPANKGAGSVGSGIKFIQKFKIYYTEDSVNLEEEYEGYEWEVINSMMLDRPVKKDDHLMDALRYVITFMQFHLGIKK